jgi:hypothetical protein
VSGGEYGPVRSPVSRGTVPGVGLGGDYTKGERDVTRDQAAAFIADLEELTRKHGIEVAACSCCHSPWLLDTARAGHYGWDYVEETGVADSIDWKPDYTKPLTPPTVSDSPADDPPGS